MQKKGFLGERLKPDPMRITKKRATAIALMAMMIVSLFPQTVSGALASGDKATVDYTNLITDINGKTYVNPDYPEVSQKRYLLKIAGAKDRYCYCIDPGTDLAANGSDLKATSIHGKHNYWASLSKRKKQGISLASMYGWRSNAVISKSEPELAGKVTEDDMWYAAQCIMWEYVRGYRTSPVSKNNNFYFKCLDGRSAEVAYKWILQKMKHHTDSWSWAVRKTADDTSADTAIVLNWNEASRKYSKTITDSNKVEYGIKGLTPKGLAVSKSGYKYTFSSGSAIGTSQNRGTDYTFGKDIEYNEQASFVWEQGSSQVMYTGSEDLIDWTVKVRTERPGYFAAQKLFDDKQKSKDGFYANYKDAEFLLKGDRLSKSLVLKVNEKGQLVDSDGNTKFKLWPGDYSLTETKSAEKYRDLATKKFAVAEDKTTSLTGEQAVINDMKEGTLSIRKMYRETNNSDVFLLKPEPDVEFLVMDLDYFERCYEELYGEKPVYGENSNVIGSEMQAIYDRLPEYTAENKYKDSIVTNGDGYAKTKSLYYGNYVVVQKTDCPDKWSADPFTVSIPQDGTDTADKLISIENKVARNKIRIEKRDAETGELISLPNTKFKVKNVATGEFVGMKINADDPEQQYVFSTDEEGVATLPQDLYYGDYEVTEVEAPYGYVLTEESFPFSVNTGIGPMGTVINVIVRDKPQMGVINIIKKGLTYESKDGMLKEKEELIPYVRFDIAAAEDIKTPDGTLRYKKDEIVDTVMTQSDGTGSSCALYLGKYKLIEKGFYKKTDEGDFKETENPGWKMTEEEVELKYGNQNDDVIYLEKTVKNQPNAVLITKSDIADGRLLSDTEISIMNSDKKEIFRGKTDSNGKVYSGPLEAGTYYYKEYKAPKGYEIDESYHKFKVTEKSGIIKAKITDRKIPKTPQTGEGRDFMYVLILLAVTGGMGCIFAYKKPVDKK